MTADERGHTHPHEDSEAGFLPDEAVVVRGGLSTPETLHKTALAHHDEHGYFAISARSLPSMAADDLARVTPPLAHRTLRETTVGAFRAAGYEVVPDEPPLAHALIILPRLPADEDYVTVSAVFGQSRQNPAYGEEQDDA
jgi:hypothetical protein